MEARFELMHAHVSFVEGPVYPGSFSIDPLLQNMFLFVKALFQFLNSTLLFLFDLDQSLLVFLFKPVEMLLVLGCFQLQFHSIQLQVLFLLILAKLQHDL